MIMRKRQKIKQLNQKTVLNQTGWRECKKSVNHEEDSSYSPEETSELSGNQRQ